MATPSLMHLSLWDSIRLNSRNRIHMVERLAAQGDCLALPLGSYFFNHPEAVIHILQKGAKHFEKQHTPYDLMREALGPGVLTLDGTDWTQARQQCQTHFHHQSIELALKQTECILPHLLSKHVNQSFSLTEMITPIISDMMLTLLCGVSSVEYLATVTPALKIINFEISQFSPFKRPIAKRKSLQRHLHQLHSSILAMAENFSPDALLGPLISGYQSESISEFAFLGAIKNFLIAGAETTASTLTWTLYNLTTNQTSYAQITEEIRQTDSPEHWLGSVLPYTQQCLEESMRMYPPIWTILRKSTRANRFGNIEINKDKLVIISPYTLHRHPEYWENPTLFNPDRFEPNQKHSRPKGVYIPFGIGRRNCIGQQLAMGVMKMCLYHLLRQCDITQISPQHPGLNPLVTLQPKHPIIVKLDRYATS